MAARIGLHSRQSRRKLLHQLLLLALIAPLLQVIQIAIPNAASAVSVSSPFTAGFNNATPGTFVIPEGVTSISINIRGGAGGKGGGDSRVGGNPGVVNVVTGNLAVTPGETITYGVGGGGTNGSGCVQNSGAGPGGNGNFGGILGNYSGGAGANTGSVGCSGGGGGGGAATVLVGPTFGTVVAAGSGGGGGGDNCIAGYPGRRAGSGTGAKNGGVGQTISGRDGGGGGGGGGGWNGGVGGTTFFPCNEFIGYGGESGSNNLVAGTSASTVSASPQTHGSITITWATPPNAPTAVTAVPGNTSASVSWTSGGTPTGGAAITGFRVSASPGTATCVVTNPATTRCTFASGSLTNGVSYTFIVVATSSIGNSPNSVASSAVVPSTYTVTYNGNSNTGGSVPTDSLSPYVTGSTVTVKANTGNLVRSEYIFAGWNTQADGLGTNRAANSTFAIGANTILYAKWNPVTYTVTYNANSGTGSVPTDSSGPYVTGSSVTVQANTGSLVRTNYHFSGWNTLSNGTGTDRAASGTATFTITANTTLFAKWSQYRLTYNSNSATGGLPPTSLTGGGAINLGGARSLARTGFYFDGWNTQADGNGQSYSSTGSFTLTQNTTLYAKWSRYSITYSTGNSTSGTAPTAQSGSGNVTLASNTGALARTDYFWDGWTTNSDGTGTKLTGTYNIGANVTLYPRWSQYTLSYNLGTATSGSVPGSALGVGSKTTATNSGSLALSGFAFTGWNTASNGTGQFYAANSTINLTANTVLYPFFSKFTITYATGSATSGTAPSAQLGAGTVTLALNSGTLARTNFYWAGWTTSSNGLGDILNGSYSLSANVTLYPRWAQYTISYDMTGNTTAGAAFITLGVGNTTLASSAPGFSKTSSTLGGWTTGENGTGDFYNLGAVYPGLTGPVTLYAKWMTAAGSVIAIANTTLNFPLANPDNTFKEGSVVINVNETAGTHSAGLFAVTVTGTNCSIIGSARNIGATSSTALSNEDTGFVLKASGIANCSVTIRRPADADFGPSTSETKVFQFYPINQITPLVVNTSVNTAAVGTPIALEMQGTNIGNGSGTVSYAAYGNNCFITISGSNYSLNATAPTQCRVIVTRAAWQQWAIATSQTAANFNFTANAQGVFVVPAQTVDFGTTVNLYTTGGNGNGAVRYSTFGTGCLISYVNQLTSSNAGKCTVVAYKSASGAFVGRTSAPAVFTFTPINQAPIAVTSSDAVDANPISAPGISLGISGGTGNGRATFSAAPTSNCQVVSTGNSTATLTATSTGKCTITAWKSGGNGYNGVLSRPVTYSFGIAPPNDLVIVSSEGIATSPKDVGFSLSTTGQVTPGGAITFARFDGNNCFFDVNATAGTVVLKSNAVGICRVQATQAASGAYTASTSGLVEFTFTGGAQSGLTLTFSSPDNSSTTTTSGSTMKMVANGGSGTGTFAYTVSSLNGATCEPVTRLNTSANGTQSFATVVSSSPGVCQVTVVKSGDGQYREVTATTSFTFTGGPQDRIYLTAASASAPSLSNVRVTFNGGSGDGAVTFRVSGVGCTLNDQSTTPNDSINVTAPSKASCRVTATKAGSGSFAAATTFNSDAVAVNFTSALQSTLTATVDGSSSGYTSTKSANNTFTISTLGGSGTGLITFEVFGNGNCKLNSSLPGTTEISSLFQSATCSVVAKKAGDDVYAPTSAAAVSLSFTAVSQDDLTILTNDTSAAVGADITLTVTGGSGTGGLSYSANNSLGGNCVITPVNANSATFTSETAGNCSITVVKSGSGIYGTKVATTATVFNFGESQEPLILAPEVPVEEGQTPQSEAGTPIILTLTGGNGEGAVTIYAGVCTRSYDQTTGHVTVNSSFATTCLVSAAKAGSGGYFGVTSNTQSVMFAAAQQKPLTIISSATSVSVFGEITVTVTGGSGSGAYRVVAYGSGCSFISNSGGIAIIKRTTAGSCSVQGLRGGGGIYGTQLSTTLALVWGSIVQTIPLVISNDPTSASAGESITLTTVGGEGSGAVTFRVVGDYNPACVLVDNQLSKSEYGTCMIRATKASDGIYSAQNSQNIVFTFYGSTVQAPLAITASSPTSSLGNTITLDTTGGSSTGLVDYKIVGGDGAGTITGNILSGSAAGTIIVVAIKQGDSQFASVVSDSVTFTFTG